MGLKQKTRESKDTEVWSACVHCKVLELAGLCTLKGLGDSQHVYARSVSELGFTKISIRISRKNPGNLMLNNGKPEKTGKCRPIP